MTTYNIIYDKTTNFTELHDALVDAGVTINKTFQNIGVINLDADNLDFTSISGVLQHEEDSLTTTELQEYYWHQLRLARKNLPLPNAYIPKNTGTDVVVYLMDTPIDTTHPEFADSTITNLWSYNDDFTPHSHGTAIASLIVGKTLGVSTGVHLKSVVIPVGETQISYLIEAFDAIMQDHDEATPSVVNCSWLINKSLILDTKIVELQNDNIIVVAAAGNLGLDANNYSPVGLDTVLGVGASDAFDRVISWGSGAIMNHGSDVDITAPGIDVSVAVIGGTIEESSGTSLACGIVSGVVAQYIVTNPSYNALQIQDAVVLGASEGVLFRNETVYGDTPNLLVFANADVQLFDLAGSRDISVQVNSSTEYVVIPRAPITSVNVENISVHGYTRVLPNWVTFSPDTLTFTFSPDDTVENNLYQFYMQGLDDNLEIVSTASVFCRVWINDPSDATDGVTRAFYEDETGEVNVRLQFCTGPDFCAFSPCEGKNCNCSGFDTCYTQF
ncbi:MAG: S8 family serine peptidase [Flavobacteriaceae bacterium]